MKYKLINRTKIPRDILEAFIEFVMPKGIKKVTISIMNENTDGIWHGDALGFAKKKSVRIWLEKGNIIFPRYSSTRVSEKAGYSPRFIIRDKYEALIALLAHELRHIWQESVSEQNFLRSRLGEYVHWDGKRMVCIKKMEKDSCQYAKKMLIKYRKL